MASRDDVRSDGLICWLEVQSAGIDGHDRILSAEAGLTWWLNRYAGLTTRVRTEKLTSNLPGRDYTANSIFLGVKVQR